MNLPDDLCLMTASDTPADTMQDVYKLAVAQDGKPPENTLKGNAKFVMDFCIKYERELMDIERKVFDEAGTFDAIVPPVMGDIQDMTADQALRLWNVTHAKLKFMEVKKHVVRYITEKFPKKL